MSPPERREETLEQPVQEEPPSLEQELSTKSLSLEENFTEGSEGRTSQGNDGMSEKSTGDHGGLEQQIGHLEDMQGEGTDGSNAGQEGDSGLTRQADQPGEEESVSAEGVSSGVQKSSSLDTSRPDEQEKETPLDGGQSAAENSSDGRPVPKDHGLQGAASELAGLSLGQEAQDRDVPSNPDAALLQPPPPPPKDEAYTDPTPKTPADSQTPSRKRSPSDPASHVEGSHSQPEGAIESRNIDESKYDEKQPSQTGDAAVDDTRSEIQSIMEQFTGDDDTSTKDVLMSPRMEFPPGNVLGGPPFPPRRSSLEPIAPLGLNKSLSESLQSPSLTSTTSALTPQKSLEHRLSSPPPPAPPPKYDPKSPSAAPSISASNDGAATPSSPGSLHKPPPPEPEPEQPFDFHRFLEQLRHRTADPVAKFLRSFLTEFGKKQWMVHEQVKIISDFLAFITNKMAQCEVWREVSDTEFDNAREGMEKLVMNRLYTQTFSPAIPPPPAPPRSKGKRKDMEKVLGPGRKGQHQEDVERDEILAQKVGIYGWVRERHLDIAPVGESGKRFLALAQQELLKIKGYRAPRDKVICVLNCCKVIFGLLRNSSAKADTSADSFVPLLIYVVLQANPEHLVSNVQYILRFRNQDKLGGEAGYYLSSLMGAIQFIESLDRTSLTVSDEEFEKSVEAAVSAIAERNKEAESSSNAPHFSEKSAPSVPEVTPRHSMEGEYATASSRRRDGGDAAIDPSEDNAAVAGLLRTIQKPLSTIGRIFSDESSLQQQQQQRSGPASTPQPGATPRLSPATLQTSRRSSSERRRSKERPATGTGAAAGTGTGASSEGVEPQRANAEEAAARQATAETAEARRIQRAEHQGVVEYVSFHTSHCWL